MMPRKQLLMLPIAAMLAALAACADSPVAPARVAVDDVSLQASEGRGVFQRYVAMGTSISMGWASDGVFSESQESSWPAQLARMAQREITQPLIQSPGCPAPIAPPLGGGVRFITGEPILAPLATLACAPLVPGVTLPTQNVAINGARTADALFSTPETAPDVASRRLYSRVLPPGETQVTAMAAQNPKIVSVELGSNEVFAARSGIALVGAPPLPILDPPTFATQYRQVLDAVEATTAKHVLLVGLPTNPLVLPAFRTGAEIAANAPVLLVGFHVAVQADCATTNAQNLIFVLLKLAPVMQAGLAAKALGQPPLPFTCAAGGPTVVDLVLTPAEQSIVTMVAAQFNAIIQAEAQARGFAYTSLDALYANPAARPPFNAATLLTTAIPFGPLMSLDGLHPNAAGQALIAQAAAEALNGRYDLGIPAFAP